MIYGMTIPRPLIIAAFGLLSACSCTSDSVNYDAITYTGIDELEQQDFALLHGQRVGLITNHTGIDRNGVSTIAAMHRSSKVNLVAIFSPEHGISGVLDIAEIDDDIETATGLRVVSLYGQHRQPTAEMLAGIDTLVFDIQDIGTRFYTYISTMGLAMQAAADSDVDFVVLDRPNVIGGTSVSGPVLDEGAQSFVGFHRIPVRHGMTVGELAGLFRAELELDLDLHVVPMRNWRRSDYFTDTGLPWVNPSPNMRSVNAAVLYPGIGLLETTNLSVGRGTDTPFELVGAPWLDGEGLAHALNLVQIEGIRIESITFKPNASKFQNEVCSGIKLSVIDPALARPLKLGLLIAVHLSANYGNQWDIDAYDRLLGNSDTLSDVRAAKPVNEIIDAWQSELLNFRERRAAHLLYD